MTYRLELCVPVIACAALLLPACGGGGGGSSDSGSGPPQYDADLWIEALEFSPLAVDAGQPILATDVVRNTGDEAVPAFRIGVYLSDDDQVTGADVLLGFRTVAELQPGAADEGGGSLTIPVQTTAGTYWVGAIADDQDAVGEEDESNNVTVATETLEVQAPELPDLVPTVVTFTPAVVDAGDAIQVDDVVENQGQAPAGPFQVGLYLSSDSVVTTADTLLGVRQVAELPPSSGDSGSGTVTIPTDTPAGFYHVGVIADDVDDVFEQSEDNNAAVAGGLLEVKTPPLPDLTPTHVVFQPTTVDAGSTIQVSEGVLNQGLSPAQGFQVGVYLSADSLIDSSDVLLGFRTVAFLGEGQEDAVQDLTLGIPPDTPAGTYWIGTWADDTAVVPESIEANNTKTASATLSVDVPPLPNLKPVTIDFWPDVIDIDAGDLLTISEEVENAGSAAAGAFRVGVYLSPNSVVTPSDVLIASRVVTALSPGGTSGSTKQVALPPGLSDGSYHVGVIADDLLEQDELSEGDNLLVADDVLDVVSTPDPQPDLIMEECSYKGHEKAPGETFQVVTRVTNEGDLSADPFHVGVYLSVDATIAPDDVLLGERFLLGGLSAGFSNVASAPVTIPAGQPEGTYHVGAYADSKLVIAELEEDDNDLTSPGTLKVVIPPPPAPELYVKSSSHDADTLAPGDTLTLDEVARNKGELDAGAFRIGFYLSDDGKIETTDVLLGSRTVAGLKKGEETSASTLLTIPSATVPGEYWLGVLVDDLQAVTENDEDDNADEVEPKVTVQ